MWNPAQATVIAAPVSARLIVDAGPGTGKTATAAGRIAALAASGVVPGSLWTISFSRAAVGEMRARLVALGGAGALGRVTTLDSLAWYLREDAEEDEGMVLEGHDRAIADTLTALRGRDPAMLNRIAAIAHFTIDEAQDLVGPRALLVVELLAALPASCGVTILTDEAQAIYGFSASALTSYFAADTIARHLLEAEDTNYRLHRLEQVHRTGDRKLLRLFKTSRAQALLEAPNPAMKLKRMRFGIVFRAHGKIGNGADAGTLILYRSRAEVLAAAQQRIGQRQPYRLRLSGLPVMLHPWIAQTLHDYKSASLPRWQFADLWAQRGIDGDAGSAWKILAQASGDADAEKIAMPRLRAILGTSHPPSELCRFDPGDGAGPVIGTIHASKGREAPRVQLMLPVGKTGRDDPDAEARVLFVGATRAKTRLEIGKGIRLNAKRLENGRVFVQHTTSAGRIEMGRPGDFIWQAAARLDGLHAGRLLTMIVEEGVMHVSHDGFTLGVASPALMADLRDIRARIGGSADYRQIKAQIEGLAFLGLYTLAGEDGLSLAPAVSGLVSCEFL